MRAAPAVGVRCTGGAAWRVFQAGMPGLAAGVVPAWVLLSGGTTGGATVALAGVLCGAGVAAWHWHRRAAPAVHLRWDGAAWSADGTVGALDVMIDLGPWMLLRLRPPAVRAARWIAVAEADAGPGWSALRAAAYAGVPARRRTDLPAPSAPD